MDRDERIHAFDFLRATAMQLGIVYHVANFYCVDPDEMWAVELRHSVIYDVLFRFIHVFRMPLFFMMSGYFTNLTIERKGLRRFLVARRRRLVYPLLLALLVINPLIVAIIAWVDGFKATFLELVAERGPKLGIFWFLYYLIFYSALALLLRGPRVAAKIPRFVFVLITWFVFARAERWTDIGYGETYVPLPGVFLYYAAFFFFGMTLKPRAIVPRRWISVAVFVIASAAVIALLPFEANGSLRAIHWLCAFAYVVAAWSAVFALIGFATHHLTKPLGRRWLYAVDASYWSYLVHLPIAIVLMFLGTKIAPSLTSLVKGPVVILLTSALCLATYALVRPTRLGALLGQHPPK